jgi:PTS system mannose-specific IIA component
MVTGIIVTHGQLAEEILLTARMVFGEFSHCYPVSNTSKSPKALLEDLETVIDAEKSEGYILFVDFLGSCSQACMRLQAGRDNVSIISGINLPIFLAFLNKRDKIPFEKLPEELVQRGRGSIQVLDIQDL